MTEGNGDTSLCLFGEKITPNLHALAREFVLLDNFYVDAEVSADGHNWSMGGYANDYLEKTWPTGYGGRGGTYDAEGNRAIANNKNGFIWDYCSRAGISYRTYGEFADDYKPNIPISEKSLLSLLYQLGPAYPGHHPRGSMERETLIPWLHITHCRISIHLRIINDHTEGLKKGSPYSFCALRRQ